MATVVNPVQKTKKDAFHGIFEPKLVGCTGACNYTWDSRNATVCARPGRRLCSGTAVNPVRGQYKSSAVRELVILEGSFPIPTSSVHLSAEGSKTRSMLLSASTLICSYATGW